MKNWVKSKLSMKRGKCLFVDQVSGKEVFEYTDCFGNKYMAEYCHWFFRVRKGATHE